MENFLSIPAVREMDLLVEGHTKARRDLSIVIELSYCFAQVIRHGKGQRYPLSFFNGSMVFENEIAIADFINNETT